MFIKLFLFFKLLISFKLKLLVMILVCLGDWETHHNLKKKKKLHSGPVLDGASSNCYLSFWLLLLQVSSPG